MSKPGEITDDEIDAVLAAYLDDTRKMIANADSARLALAEILVSENTSPNTEEWI
jgi:hypothetical protein